jgi:hypothetical protein
MRGEMIHDAAGLPGIRTGIIRSHGEMGGQPRVTGTKNSDIPESQF